MDTDEQMMGKWGNRTCPEHCVRHSPQGDGGRRVSAASNGPIASSLCAPPLRTLRLCEKITALAYPGIHVLW